MSKLFSVAFWDAATGRAFRSFCQGLLVGGIENLAGISDWQVLITSAVGMAVASYLTSIIAGLPEHEPEE